MTFDLAQKRNLQFDSSSGYSMAHLVEQTFILKQHFSKKVVAGLCLKKRVEKYGETLSLYRASCTRFLLFDPLLSLQKEVNFVNKGTNLATEIKRELAILQVAAIHCRNGTGVSYAQFRRRAVSLLHENRYGKWANLIPRAFTLAWEKALGTRLANERDVRAASGEATSRE